MSQPSRNKNKIITRNLFHQRDNVAVKLSGKMLIPQFEKLTMDPIPLAESFS